MPAKRGRPEGWRKRPAEKEWRSYGILLPEDAYKWILKNKDLVISLARGGSNNVIENKNYEDWGC